LLIFNFHGQITGIRMACTSPKAPFNYRIFTAAQPYQTISLNSENWVEVGAGQIALPEEVGQYAAIPLESEVRKAVSILYSLKTVL
jgi:hypothetical protein